MTILKQEDSKVRLLRSEPQIRTYLRVPNFDEIQNPSRPDRPTWLKLFVRDLQDPDWLELTLSVRGFATEFQKLAAGLRNRVPDDVKYIARMVGTPPAVAGKMLNTCLKHEFIARFAEDLETSKINDIKQKTGSPPIPASLSNSNFESLSSIEDVTVVSTLTDDPCSKCDGEGCRWCESSVA